MSHLPGPSGPSWQSEMQMPFKAEALPLVRRQLLAEVRAHHIDDDVAYDAALVLSELVSNALRHASPLREGVLSVEWGCWDDQLHICVTDGGATTEPHVAPAAPHATGGRGLAIVRAVCLEWGLDRTPAATTVWASLRASVTGPSVACAASRPTPVGASISAPDRPR